VSMWEWSELGAVGDVGHARSVNTNDSIKSHSHQCICTGKTSAVYSGDLSDRLKSEQQVQYAVFLPISDQRCSAGFRHGPPSIIHQCLTLESL
jgi:hypothetical protein